MNIKYLFLIGIKEIICVRSPSNIFFCKSVFQWQHELFVFLDRSIQILLQSSISFWRDHIYRQPQYSQTKWISSKEMPISTLPDLQKRQRRNATNVTTVVGGSRRRESWQDTRRERTATNLSSARAAARLSSWRHSWRTTGSIAQALLTSVKNVEKF